MRFPLALIGRVLLLVVPFYCGVLWSHHATLGQPQPPRLQQRPTVVAAHRERHEVLDAHAQGAPGSLTHGDGGLTLPDKAFGACWAVKEDCEFYGLCDLPNPFQPRIEREALMKCGPLPTDATPGKMLQLYHVSKCGGTTINTLLKSKSDGGAGGLTQEGQRLLRHERENAFDPTYTAGIRPNSTFIIGLIRNPFEYYVSFWSMFTLSKMKGTGDCLRRTAIEAGRKDLFDNRGRRNLKQFRAWIHFLFVESCDSCQLSMWRVFQLLYIGSQGQCPSYDRLVRLEDFYPTLTSALKDYEAYSPGTIEWGVIEAWKNEKHNTIRDGPECPYHCFFDEHTRKLVELHDAPLLDYFHYSFEGTARRHGGAEACRKSGCV
eukprot:m.15907 g.15907  ORF g.15907 m.15907 type:complete len:376 (+) comp8839_c0_seq1:57-1184(+)